MQGWNKKWDEWVEAGGLTKYDVKLVTAGDGAATAHDGSGVAGGSVCASAAATTGTKRKAAEQPASSVIAMAGSPPAKVVAVPPPRPVQRATLTTEQPEHYLSP